MRTLLVAALIGLAAAPATADDPAPKKAARPARPEPTLKPGDPAPPLKVDAWLRGDAVKEFEPGKVYVVEFWATWCGPCIVMMPHLADLADEYKAKGVTVVGFSSKAQDQRDKAEAFVGKRGPKLGYTFAWGDDSKTHEAWMNAAGQGGIPCSFVVDGKGRVAYIGHPMHLDGVLPRVLDGTWDPAKGADEVAAAEKDFERAYAASMDKDPAAGLKAFEAVLAGRPALAEIPYLLGPRLELLVKNKRFDEARALAEKVLSKAAKRDDTQALRTLRAALMGDAAKGDAGLVGLAVKASEQDRAMSGPADPGAAVRLAAAYAAAGDGRAKEVAAEAVGLAEKAITGDKDWQGHLLAASAYKAAGDGGRAKAAAEKAMAVADGQRGLRDYVAGQVKEYGVEPEPRADAVAASKLLEDGLAEAKKAGKGVFLTFDGGDEFSTMMSAFHARKAAADVLGKHLVFVKVDLQDDGAVAVYRKYSPEPAGAPFWVILSADGKVLADALEDKDRARSNVGFPVEPNEVAHYEKALRAAVPKMTDADIKTVLAELKAAAPKPK